MNNNMYEKNDRMNTFETCNRRLEQFLFVHDIHFTEWYKNEDGLTTWVYPDNGEVREVVKEFRKLDERRRERRLNTSLNMNPTSASFQSSFGTRLPATQTKYGPRPTYTEPEYKNRNKDIRKNKRC